jgi:PPM family protein phosphatase
LTKFVWAARTSKGERPVNEDSWRAQCEPIGCFVVADGLGGHSGGDIASAVVSDAALAGATRISSASQESAVGLINAAADALRGQQAENILGMRSTLTVLLIDGVNAAWAWVGDTRLYRFSAGRVVFRTPDHTVAGKLVASGELAMDDIRYNEDRSILLRALGSHNQTPEISQTKCKPDDTWLICSDGWWEPVHDEEMELLLGRSSTLGDWLDAMEALAVTRSAGKSDNRTAIAIKTQ